MCPTLREVRSRGSQAGQGGEGQGALPAFIGLTGLQRAVWKLLPWLLQPRRTQGGGHVGRSAPCWEVLETRPCLQALQPGSPLPQGEPLPGKPLEGFWGAWEQDGVTGDPQTSRPGLRVMGSRVKVSSGSSHPTAACTYPERPLHFSFLSTIPLDSSQQQREVSHRQT